MTANIFRANIFDGKTAIVTGGGTGIGYCIAELLSGLGCTVIIASRKLDKLKQSADKLNETSRANKSDGKVIPCQLNVRDSNSIKNFIKTLKSDEYNINKIDYLINNAGGQYLTPSFENLSEKGWKSVIDLNLTAMFLMSQQIFKEYFKKQRYGKIINITANYLTGMPHMIHSGAARGGAHMLTISMAQHLSKYNVTVNEIAPGFIKTSGLKKYPEQAQKLFFLQTQNNYFYKYGTPSDVANCVLFLLTQAGDFITGARITIDGGESIYHPLAKPTKPFPKPKATPASKL